MNKTSIENLAEILNCDVKVQEPMSRHTTFKIGGNAEAYIKVGTLSKLSTIVKECSRSSVDYMVIGNGSNLLVGDDGINKAVISLDGEFKKVVPLEDDMLYCGAGASLATVCKAALNNGLSGLEFAWGIPGTLGGAVFMNAGAYGGEMKDVVYSVSHITAQGEIGRCEKDVLGFGYRDSIYRKNGCVITGAFLKLKKAPKSEIQSQMDDYLKRRSSKQPLDFPSAGSVFKRPQGAFAGELIERCGLKGRRVGGAEVSEKHAGFIINRGGATADDVKNLIAEIKNTVREKTGYDLECELIVL